MRKGLTLVSTVKLVLTPFGARNPVAGSSATVSLLVTCNTEENRYSRHSASLVRTLGSAHSFRTGRARLVARL